MSDKKEQDLINPDDFLSMELCISMRNVTTQTAIKDGKRSYGTPLKSQMRVKEQDLSIRIVELLEVGMVLEVPIRTCAEGHTLELEIRIEGMNRPATLYTIATVQELGKISDSRDQIAIEFTDFESEDWELIKCIYQERQNEIFNFFNAVRGY